ncbi:unnamed protein product [Ambrosiozyma monospora]|uniref:Unnamed protein product n=1 Tax=Ambrosiozyma monospora TaxID=43982 RepID=A0ACB5T6U1_AMBMO|nr:unnamed protein product [Ambrosiozyma monospora]
MTISNSNLNSKEIGIKLASCLLPEIQTSILKFIIEYFLCFINDIDYNTVYFSDHTTITCSDNMQAQLLSMTRYDDLLDGIICMALEELDLKLTLNDDFDGIFVDEFINFVTSRSVKLKSIEVWAYEFDLARQFSNPNTLKLLESHSNGVFCQFASMVC